MIDRCPICSSTAVGPLLRATSPVLMMSRRGREPRPDWFAELDLVLCHGCGHAFNRAFSDDLAPRLYGDVQLTNVPVSPAMIGRLASLRDWLGDILDRRRVLEIGSGSGHLARILSQSASEVVLYEPCVALTRDMVPETNIRLETATYPQGRLEEVDVVICRQVIEHVSSPLDLLRDIRRSLPAGGHAYLEVPDADFIAAHAALPDIHLQHVQYFTQTNFVALAAKAGLAPLRTLPLVNGHDFGVLFQAVDRCDPPPFRGIAGKDLAERLADRRVSARRAVASLPGPVALYGACPHSQIFLNHVGDAARFAAVLDDNPRNQGWSLYSAEQVVPVVEAATAPLADYGAIVIGAYLHDRPIADRVEKLGGQGRILTINPAMDPADTARLPTVYD
ncbi:MAG: class I SAM-dependent methyltransferase [Alphaproteobacteria bacterium]|nr:class I SAM-dependent methyltransferase [Alphaproteobacteria bacterium]